MIARLFIVSVLLLASHGLLQADSPRGLVKSVTGEAVLVTADGKSVPITNGTIIPTGGKIQTGTNGKLIIEWLPGAFSVVFPNSNVTASSMGGSAPAGSGTQRQVLISLIKGTVFCHLTHDAGVSAFSVKTPAGVAAARGCDYFVNYNNGNGQATVSVLTDTVSITLPNGTVTIASALFDYLMGAPSPTKMTEQELTTDLNLLSSAGLTVTLVNINDVRAGFTITYTPAIGDGFQFFIPKPAPGSDNGQLPPGSLPPGSTQTPVPNVPPASL